MTSRATSAPHSSARRRRFGPAPSGGGAGAAFDALMATPSIADRRPAAATQFPQSMHADAAGVRFYNAWAQPRDRAMADTQSDDYEQKRAELRRSALEYHEFPTPGKIAIAATKQLINQRDLALAYSPGVAAACEEIVADPVHAFRYTSRGNLVAGLRHRPRPRALGVPRPPAGKPARR